MRVHGVSFALHNTDIVVISNERINQIFLVHLDDVNITTNSKMKYLGVLLEQKLTFWEPVKSVSDKARKVIISLSRLKQTTYDNRE